MQLSMSMQFSRAPLVQADTERALAAQRAELDARVVAAKAEQSADFDSRVAAAVAAQLDPVKAEANRRVAELESTISRQQAEMDALQAKAAAATDAANFIQSGCKRLPRIGHWVDVVEP